MTTNFFDPESQVKHREVWNNKYIVDHISVWTQNLDMSARQKILEDVESGYEGGFDTPVSGMAKDEFLKKYDDVLEKFISKWNEVLHDPTFNDARPGETQPAIGNVKKELAWTRVYNKGDDCKIHNHTGNLGKIAFTAIHLVKLEKDHPLPWMQIGPERIDIYDLRENDVFIFPSIIPHGVDPNPIDSKRITFMFDFTVELLED